jgi:hypothetical protein
MLHLGIPKESNEMIIYKKRRTQKNNDQYLLKG